jgi:hypothetical protein
MVGGKRGHSRDSSIESFELVIATDAQPNNHDRKRGLKRVPKVSKYSAPHTHTTEVLGDAPVERGYVPVQDERKAEFIDNCRQLHFVAVSTGRNDAAAVAEEGDGSIADLYDGYGDDFEWQQVLQDLSSSSLGAGGEGEAGKVTL